MLTDTKIHAAKGRERPYKLSAGEGLYLLVNPNHRRLWRFRYKYAGRENLLSFGAYDPGSANHVSLAEAKERLREARAMLRADIDPSAVRRAQKQARIDREQNSFEIVAREWHAPQSPRWRPKQITKELRQLTLHVLPVIGPTDIRIAGDGPALCPTEDRGQGPDRDRASGPSQHRSDFPLRRPDAAG